MITITVPEWLVWIAIAAIWIDIALKIILYFTRKRLEKVTKELLELQGQIHRYQTY